MRTEDAIDATGVAITAKVTQVGALSTFFSWLVSSEGGMLVGIVIGLIGLVVNLFYQHRRDKREQIEHEKRMSKMETAPAALHPRG